MKKTVLAIGIMAALFTGCSDDKKEVSADMVNNPNTASTEEANQAMPKLVFAEEAYDFGTVTQGEKVQYAYEFTNDGDADLIISSAKGSCGCTVPQWPKEPIKPGEKAVIDVVFDSNGKSGKQHKKVTVVANTMPATTVVAIKGEVIAPEKSAE